MCIPFRLQSHRTDGGVPQRDGCSYCPRWPSHHCLHDVVGFPPRGPPVAAWLSSITSLPRRSGSRMLTVMSWWTVRVGCRAAVVWSVIEHLQWKRVGENIWGPIPSLLAWSLPPLMTLPACLVVGVVCPLLLPEFSDNRSGLNQSTHSRGCRSQ